MNSPSGAMKILLRGIGTVLKGVGTIIQSIVSVVDLVTSCGGLSAIQLGILITLNLAVIIGLAYVTFITGGAMGLLLNSILSSFFSIVSSLALNIVKDDVGC